MSSNYENLKFKNGQKVSYHIKPNHNGLAIVQGVVGIPGPEIVIYILKRCKDAETTTMMEEYPFDCFPCPEYCITEFNEHEINV